MISGEHGIGVEKRDYMDLLFSTDDLAAMAGLKKSFDPLELFNPGKVFPRGVGCGELTALRAAGIHALYYYSLVWDVRVASAHPEWRQLDRDGKAIGGDPSVTWPWLCMNSPYLEQVVREKLPKHRPG